MKKITLGICGAMGASNSDNYISILSQFYEVNVILTKHAVEFVSKEAIKHYSSSVHSDLFGDSSYVEHVKNGTNCDCFIILPATANCIGKIANGIADDLLTSTVLNYTGTLYIAPSMNQTMWTNRVVQDNVTRLKKYGHKFINRKHKGIEAYDKRIVEIDCGLPTPRELLEIIQESINEQ